MSIFTSRPALRWLVPVAVTVAVVGGGAAARTVVASAEPDLPARSAAQLLVDLQTAQLDGLSGTVRTNADLGLPELPSMGGGGQAGSDLSSLVTGAHTSRVWYSGPDKARVALLSTLGEHDIIRNGKDVWSWDSHTNKATHRTISSTGAEPAQPHPPVAGLTPQEAADQALKAIDPSTAVETGTNARVAGRPAYELVLKPRDTQSLIGEVRLAIDADHHVPLRVLVYARSGGDPAYEVAFTQINFARPADAQFAWNPPAGTTVEEQTDSPSPARQAGGAAHAAPDGTKVVGTGWTSVIVAKRPAGATGQPDRAGSAGALLDKLPQVSGPWGSGKLLSGKLFSMLLTDDGRLIAGAVAPERLYEAARG